MYLETILLLTRRSSNVHAVNIAEELGYSRASVSRGVNLLVKRGYIVIAPSGEISFTAEGKAKAEHIYERHTVITKLLVKIGADSELAEENACRIEHVITPELFEVLKKFAYN
ncbi:MAG: metal-dependent transcriptional regulator [Clostridia bacterium]|nr:metal-dependent transcriptional regulator [Clostridia bacterium]MDE6758052.1 metal-dependent transcriptional regulator [Clostridia bacterium]MDE7078739.1 metal-dependent transcriptional regulator [Clostridia bacterium]